VIRNVTGFATSSAELQFGEYGEPVGDERNIMHIVFAHKTHRKLLVD